MDIQAGCLFCDEDVETMHHLLSDCWWVRKAFVEAGLSHIPKLYWGQLILHWVDAVAQDIGIEQVTRLLTCIWQVWYMRNQIFHHNCVGSTKDVGRRVDNLLDEFREAHSSDSASAATICSSLIRWRPPSGSYVKVNFDAALQDSKVGVGIIARNSDGMHLASRIVCLKGPSNPFFAECLAAKEAVLFAKDLCCDSIILEGDSLLTITGLNRVDIDLSATGLCLRSIKDLFPLFSSVKCNHVKRRANNAADLLAKHALLGSGSRNWSGICPDFLLSVIALDCSLVSS
ncbi:uncharacterized protein LOC120003527 [Tripterygium wilfordii]|uniref:uncharacterized protein LOC120003527 n=1 Tax=Tripterygium wilfordii TaxID=458696 RepID=UPI0018F81CE8|nr:uncharacterized protein LOC120003527 [Tripterygium wilfordii]